MCFDLVVDHIGTSEVVLQLVAVHSQIPVAFGPVVDHLHIGTLEVVPQLVAVHSQITVDFGPVVDQLYIGTAGLPLELEAVHSQRQIHFGHPCVTELFLDLEAVHR